MKFNNGGGGGGASSSLAAQNKKIDGLRAAAMAIERAAGRSIAEIARSYDVTPGTVKKYLSTAEEMGVVEHLRSTIFNRLGGKILAVYEAHLDMGNLDAARDLANGLGILKKSAADGKTTKIIDTLDAYREERTKHAAIESRPGSAEGVHHSGGEDREGIPGVEPERTQHPAGGDSAPDDGDESDD